MEAKRLLPYVVALLLIAFALGSLQKSQPGGGNLLYNSTWLLYVLYLLPLIAFGGVVALTIYLALNWRDLSDGLGFGMAGKRRQRKPKNQAVKMIVWISAWAFAIMFLVQKCGGIFCHGNSNSTLASLTTHLVTGSTAGLDLSPLGGGISQAIGFFSTDWFYVSVLGLLVLSSLIVARGALVSWKDAKEQPSLLLPGAKDEGVVAVQDAIRILDDVETADDRMKIINCYQRMIRAASDLGAPISMDQTARELELGIRRALLLSGPGIKHLTQLFEEARYSLHPMTGEDSQNAHNWLVSIAEELNRSISIQV